MAVPRPLLLALIGVVLLAATFMATRGSSEQASSASSPDPKVANVAPATPAQAKAEAPAAKKPEAKSSAAKPAAKSSAKPASKARPARRDASLSRVASVARALDKRRVVVLAFFAPGADDRLVRSAVDSLSRKQAAVYSERLSRIGRYRDLIGSLGVSQAPAVVIIDRQRQARVVEGYVDAETLAQEVTDARG